jgi:predicted ATP-grasp superfamily ATP-dependent carboligase
MKQNVLVFPCGSEIGLEIYKSLSHSTHFNIFGGSSTADHGEFVYENYIGDLPTVDSPTFTEELNSVIDKYDIDFVLPAHDSVVLRLAQEKAAGRLKCAVITAAVETCEIARSKLKTYETFKDVIRTPKIYKTIEEVADSAWPIFLKPDVGQGSKGVHLAENPEDATFYRAKDSSLLLLENLTGQEYTVDCFTNKDGKLLFSEGRVRQRISGGISVNSATVDDERFIAMANAINQKIKLRGVWFFQVKENAEQDLVLMEIAPRVAGTMGLARCKGVNLVLLSLFDAMDYGVSVFENSYTMVIDRALENIYKHDIQYKHAYLDFDDLVIFEGRINPSVMAFVYQCINNEVAVHLLTRHKENLERSLKKYRLGDTFDELIWVTDGSEKHTYIKEKDAIFIDDSFAEREKVHQALEIPVFDSHMIESLMEKG